MSDGDQSPSARLAKIEQELLEMDMTPEIVKGYIHALSTYPDRSGMLNLPPGTMPHTQYESTLNDLLDSMHKATQAAQAAQAALEQMRSATQAAQAAKAWMPNSHGVVTHQLSRQTECLQQQIKYPMALKKELYLFLTRFKPINAEAHRARLDALVDEKISILTEIRRSAICSIAAEATRL
jgi:hypothetical protein